MTSYLEGGNYAHLNERMLKIVDAQDNQTIRMRNSIKVADSPFITELLKLTEITEANVATSKPVALFYNREKEEILIQKSDKKCSFIITVFVFINLVNNKQLRLEKKRTKKAGSCINSLLHTSS